MNTYRNLTLMILTMALCFAFATRASAQDIENRLRVSFSQPVEIPGVVLPAGKYVIESVEPGNLTRVLSDDEKHVYATLFTIPDERMEPSASSVVLAREHAAGSPERIQGWLNPGSSTGKDFVYSNPSGEKDIIN